MIFANLKAKAACDNLSCIKLMWLFFSFYGSGSDKAAPVFRLEGQEVCGKPPLSVSFIH